MIRTIIAAGMIAGALATAAPASATYYENCTEARQAGVTPILEGQDGYAPHLDRDHDGVACE